MATYYWQLGVIRRRLTNSTHTIQCSHPRVAAAVTTESRHCEQTLAAGYRLRMPPTTTPTPYSDERRPDRHASRRSRALTHNAIQGRFRQVDPMPGQDGITDTAYSYASNDPVNRIDAIGMRARPFTQCRILNTGPFSFVGGIATISASALTVVTCADRVTIKMKVCVDGVLSPTLPATIPETSTCRPVIRRKTKGASWSGVATPLVCTLQTNLWQGWFKARWSGFATAPRKRARRWNSTSYPTADAFCENLPQY